MKLIEAEIRTKSSQILNSYQLDSFFNLMKPRVMSLVLFTCSVGLLIAPNNLDFYNSAMSLLAVALGAGAAGTLNMWYESDVDALMSRTCLRPIPSGKVTKNQALTFGLFLSVLSVGLLNFYANFVAAFLLLITISFYFFIYTIWLKRKTPQNIVIGGAAGALPPVIGWSISTGTISVEPIILFLIIFFWTPSHFWALSLYKSNDYKKANIPMLPVISGSEKTKKNILIYSVLMLPTVTAYYLLNLSSLIYFVPSICFTLYYILLCVNLLKTKTIKKRNIIVKNIFIFSIFYLFALFFLILLDNFFMNLYG